MKKILFTLFVYTFVLLISSCGNKTQDDHSGVHSHADGTVHQDGDQDHEEQAKPEQESFVVEADSTEVHDHDHNHDHQH
jgi:hypothetical protein